MLKYVKGDLLEAKEDFICHQVNCMGVMGSGVAKQIADKWPKVKCMYRKLCSLFPPEARSILLGRIQAVQINETQQVINIFGQCDYGRDRKRVYTDYDALEQAFFSIRRRNKSYAFPYRFGCGLANGDWTIVRSLIENILAYDHEVVIYERDAR